ncbi:hypothetical protein [Aphanizomenon flos-aquae]|jgi:hypothetical protein|uniref:hypothetical protein n=1 Tax=Aphanizomenon flos-aquae TaxID=1176 RepID=UPI0018EFE0B7|nr:hypothetical protein [Aphanizomenon flos-aquae]
MVNKVRFAFTEVDPSLGALSTLPYLPLTLTYQNQSLNVSGLLDTGSSVNVLPYEMGLALGAVWEHQRLSLPLGAIAITNHQLQLLLPEQLYLKLYEHLATKEVNQQVYYSALQEQQLPLQLAVSFADSVNFDL